MTEQEAINVPRKSQKIVKKYGKHQWKRKEDGTIDEDAWEYDIHGGVLCERCGANICIFCNPDYEKLEDCGEEYWLCPACGKRYEYKCERCKCGQAMDWSKE